MNRMGELWKELSEEQKKPYQERARVMQDEFRKKYPEYNYKQKKPKKELTDKEKYYLFENSLPIDPSYLVALGLQTLLQQSNAYNASYFANIPAFSPVSMPPPPPSMNNKSRTATMTSSNDKNRPKENITVPAMPPPPGSYPNMPPPSIPSMPPPSKGIPNQASSMPRINDYDGINRVQQGVRFSSVSEFSIPTMPPPSNTALPTMPPPTNAGIPRMPPPPPTRTPSMPPPPPRSPSMPPPPSSSGNNGPIIPMMPPPPSRSPAMPPPPQSSNNLPMMPPPPQRTSPKVAPIRFY
ncbi:hypothetical protein TVAG_390840 [Trichomonas vaginalis G3]|uniref:HMG box domain-containing protein n=2 Tax=Trichomonas vaginalis (strain ATCC PRA-98 / G3) TaxID=412133 RepID=A2FDZ8_TRIV3|nr:hypothetical protein TVAG_390840 [Trichomonas vaginalis G3]|eukprot:XP_001309807.1 hypothetical protein [Trichomonas vaginalis G3]